MSIIKAKFDESACIINRLRLKWNGEVQQMNLAKRMAYLKKRDGLTTEMLSQRSGVATGTLNKLLNGATRRPALETMERVARAFGVPVRYFTDAAVLGTEFEVGAYVEEQGMFAISARERDMLEMLRELSAYERDFFTKTLETMYEMRAEHREGGPTRELFCYLPSFPMDSAVSIGTMTAQRIRVAIMKAIVANFIETALRAQQHAILRQLERAAGGHLLQQFDGIALAIEMPGNVQADQVDKANLRVLLAKLPDFTE